MQHELPVVQGFFEFEPFYRQMVQQLPADARCVEVGVFKGASLFYLYFQGKKLGKEFELYGVDNGSMHNMAELARNRIAYAVPCPVVLCDSVVGAELFEDASLDFVFIDACHDYPAVKADIEAWLPKVKAGGIIAGHDYLDPVYAGVTQAVHELLGPCPAFAGCWAKVVA